MKRIRTGIVMGSVMCASMAFANYDRTDAVLAMADRLEAQGVDRAFVLDVMAQANKLDSVLNAMRRPAERKAWRDYRPIFLKPERVEAAKGFYATHRETLERAESTYGVSIPVILAIIGVETYYGRNKGSFRVVDALATLAFDYPPRSAFFLRELEQLFLLSREETLDPVALKGSYAGAMGFGQFIPSSYRAYAVDFDKDGSRDLIGNPVDAIGSVANYLAVHGWDAAYGIAAPVQNGAPAVEKMEAAVKVERSSAALAALGVQGIPAEWAALPLDVLGLQGAAGDEYWVVTKNLYVITRYNRSPLYAMAVTQLAAEIENALGL